MFMRNGKYLCILCGEELDVPLDARPNAVIERATDQLGMRTISLDGNELHRCSLQPNSD